MHLKCICLTKATALILKKHVDSCPAALRGLNPNLLSLGQPLLHLKYVIARQPIYLD